MSLIDQGRAFSLETIGLNLGDGIETLSSVWERENLILRSVKSAALMAAAISHGQMTQNWGGLPPRRNAL